jgi:hypothetical protein
MIMLSPARSIAGNAIDRAAPEFLWVEDEGLLRDEGVLFGLARDDGGLKAKEECIRAYFLLCRAETTRVRGALEAELARLESLKEPPQPREAEGSPVPEGSPAALAVRYALGIMGAAAACAGTAVLVHEQLRAAIGPAAPVTAGVVAAGFFTSFLPVSLLFTADGAERPGRTELWKIRLAEFGLPLAAALFVAAWSAERLGLVRTVATAVLLFLVFAFCGRQVLSSIIPFGAALGAMRTRRAASPADARETAEARADEVRRALAALRSGEEWDALRDAKLALFRSEFELAAAARRQSPRAPVS